MAFKCFDCGAMSKIAPNGKCPACLSTNIRAIKKAPKEKEVKRTHKLKLVLLALAWSAFFIELYRLTAR